MLGMVEIKQYLRGQEPGIPNKSITGDLTLNEIRDHMSHGRLLNEDKTKKEYRKKEDDQVELMRSIKKEKHMMRMQRDQSEQDMMDLLKDLEQRKERELRADIEKEEIKRQLKDLDKKQLTALERERKKELERLMSKRDNLKNRENSMIEEIKRMEQQLLEQEKHFRKQRGELEQNPNEQFATNAIRQKEMEMAKARGDQIVKIKYQRDQLEKERNRILGDLDKVKNGQFNGVRRNDVLRNTGERLATPKVNDQYDKYQAIEPSLKEKLTTDQVRINYLREQQRKTLNGMMDEIDDIDVLQKENEGRNFPNEVLAMTEEYAGRRTPNQAQYMGAIRQSLENQAAGPSSYNAQGYHPNNQANIPPHVPAGEGKRKLLEELEQLKQDYLGKGGADAGFMDKLASLENYVAYNKKLPPQQSNNPYMPANKDVNEINVTSNPQYNPYYGAAFGTGGMSPPGIPPMPGMGAPGYGGPPPMPGMPPVPPSMSPFQDPMLSQMNQLLMQQENDNQKLRELVEGNIGGGAYSSEFENIMTNTNQQLEQLKNQILPGSGLGGGDEEEEPFPEDFVFRQNEFRCEDLEVEERAIMNIQAQEYDMLRVISKLPTNSELYRYKMDQFKEISTMRAEIEKVLQEQRLEKIRRDFEKQKYEDERRFRHEKWLEDQKRQILEAKLRNAGGGPRGVLNDEMNPIPMTQGSMRSQINRPGQPLKTQDTFQSEEIKTPVTKNSQAPPSEYDPNVGFVTFFDFMFNLPREYKQVQLVYSAYSGKRTMLEPRLVKLTNAEVDLENQSYNKVTFNTNQIVRHIKPNPNTNMIIEVQVPDQSRREGMSSFGWTIINLFDPSLQLNKGRFRLPIYKPSVLIDLDVRDIKKLIPLMKINVCMRISLPKDEIYKFQPSYRTNAGQYTLPWIHDLDRDLEMPPPFSNQPSQSPSKSPTKKSTLRKSQPPKSQLNRDGTPNNLPQKSLNRDQNYDCRGIKVLFHYVKHVKHFSKLKIQATLYEGVDMIRTDNNEDCNWATSSIDKGDIISVPKGSQVQTDLDGKLQIIKPNDQILSQVREYGENDLESSGDSFVLPINQDVEWMKDIYNLQWDHHLKENIYLLIQMFIIYPNSVNSELGNGNQFEPMGYTVFKINSDQDGTIRFGSFEQNIYKMPIDLFNLDPNQMIPARVKFSIIQPQIRPLSVKSQLPSRGNEPPKSKQYIPNFDKQYTASEEFDDGDGIDVYIDWARYLPDNAMLTRLYIRAFNSNLQEVGEGQRGLASLELSTARNPFFGFKYELRSQKFDPTTLILISFETIDRKHNRPSIAGHSFFPIFMDKTNKMPVTDSRAGNYTLHKGAYQMPLYCQHPVLETPFTYENMIYLERIPTASALIRIYKAPKGVNGQPLGMNDFPPDQWGSQGVLIPAPTYAEGVYSTNYYRATPLEHKLWQIRRSRRDPPIDLIIKSMLRMNNINRPMDEDELLEWFDQLLNMSTGSPIIDMNYFSQYEPEFGFRVGVEAIHQNNQKGFFAVFLSINPPASFYDPNRQGPPGDLVPFTKLQMQSTLHTPIFDDDQFSVGKMDAGSNINLIFDVKVFKPEFQNWQDYGWAAMNLFDIFETDEDSKSVEYYINSGIYQLVLYKGAPNQTLIKDIGMSKEPLSTLALSKKKYGVENLGNTSIIVKIVDNQRERHFDKSFEDSRINDRYIPVLQKSKYMYGPQTQSPAPGLEAPIQSIVPRGEELERFQQFLIDSLFATYRL